MTIRKFNISDNKGRDVATLTSCDRIPSDNKIEIIEGANPKAFEHIMGGLNKIIEKVCREFKKADEQKRKGSKKMDLSSVSQADISDPRDLFCDMIQGKDSHYAFYLFGWVDHHGEDCKRYRLKMKHDIMLKDGTIIEGCRPNGCSWHGPNGQTTDDNVDKIRLSKDQSWGSKDKSWTKPEWK